MEQFRVIFVSDLHIGASPNWLAPRLGGIKSFVKSFSKRVAISVDASQEAAQHWMAPSSHDPQAIDALGAWLYQERNTIDAVCISGDIGRTGEQSDYAAVSAVLTGSASKSAPYPWQRGGGEPSLSFLNDDQSGGNPIFVPGNHDRFTGIMMSPTSRAFEHLFCAFYATISCASVKINVYTLIPLVFHSRGKKLIVERQESVLFLGP